MESGVIWVGIVAPTVSLVVSVYLVWRAIRDERRFLRQERERRRSAAEPDWLPDPESWREGLNGWQAYPSGEGDDDSTWSPDDEGGIGTSGRSSWESGTEEWRTGPEEWRPDPEEWRPDGEGWRSGLGESNSDPDRRGDPDGESS